jgi:hypothetical protein
MLRFSVLSPCHLIDFKSRGQHEKRIGFGKHGIYICGRKSDGGFGVSGRINHPVKLLS